MRQHLLDLVLLSCGVLGLGSPDYRARELAQGYLEHQGHKASLLCDLVRRGKRISPQVKFLCNRIVTNYRCTGYETEKHPYLGLLVPGATLSYCSELNPKTKEWEKVPRIWSGSWIWPGWIQEYGKARGLLDDEYTAEQHAVMTEDACKDLLSYGVPRWLVRAGLWAMSKRQQREWEEVTRP